MYHSVLSKREDTRGDCIVISQQDTQFASSKLYQQEPQESYGQVKTKAFNWNGISNTVSGIAFIIN